MVWRWAGECDSRIALLIGALHGPDATVLSHSRSFSGLSDPRRSGRVIYPWPEIRLLVLCATLSGMDDYVEIRLWGIGGWISCGGFSRTSGYSQPTIGLTTRSMRSIVSPISSRCTARHRGEVTPAAMGVAPSISSRPGPRASDWCSDRRRVRSRHGVVATVRGPEADIALDKTSLYNLWRRDHSPLQRAQSLYGPRRRRRNASPWAT